MTRRLPSRPDRNPASKNLPDITYRHILAPSAPAAAAPSRAKMERSSYANNRRPSFGPRRSSSHVGRRDASDFADGGHRTLAVRPKYPERAKSSSVGYDSGIRAGSVIYCPPQARPVAMRPSAVAASYAVATAGDPFAAALEEMPRRAEVYEVPLAYASDLDGGARSRSSAQTSSSRPSSRGSEYVYTEYEDDEERERKRFLGTELYGYMMAVRLKERLVDVRQVLNLYKDFDRLSGGELLLLIP